MHNVKLKKEQKYVQKQYLKALHVRYESIVINGHPVNDKNSDVQVGC